MGEGRVYEEKTSHEEGKSKQKEGELLAEDPDRFKKPKGENAERKQP